MNMDFHKWNCSVLLLLVICFATNVQSAEVSIDQEGDGNSIEFDKGFLEEALIDVSINQSGENNLIDLALNSDLQAFIEQAGVGGVISVEASGGTHSIRTLQDGVSNSMVLSLFGSGFDGTLEQSGANNSMSLQNFGVDNQAIIHQSGSQNTMILIQSGTGNTANLTQTGTGNLLEVEQSTSNLLVSVEQAGSNGVVKIN